MDFFEFIENKNLKNAWIYEPNLHAYVRKSFRYYNNTLRPFIDVASVEVDLNVRSKGVFSSFLKKVEAEAFKTKRGVYVESILENRLTNFLLNKDYNYFPNTPPEAPSMFKLFDI